MRFSVHGERLSALVRGAGAVARSPAILFSGGNLVWALATAETLGIALNVAVFSGVLATKIYDVLTGRKTGVPFYIIAAANALTAVSVLAEGVMTLGAAGLFDPWGMEESRKYLLSALAFAGWAAAHFLFGWQEKKAGAYRGVWDNPQTHAGYADVAIVQADPAAAVNYVSLFFMVAGFVRALCGDGDAARAADGRRGFLRRHVTPARLYGAGYLAGSVMALGNPVYAAAQFLWGMGYFLMYPGRNAGFWADLRRLWL